MQRFQFQLDAVLEWRRSRFEVEEGKLRALFAERARLEQRAAELACSEREERDHIKTAGATVSEKVALDDYLRWVKLERQRLSNLGAECEQAILAQRAVVLGARRDYELLERLRERRRGEWDAAFTKEIEQFAAEAYLAGFNRR